MRLTSLTIKRWARRAEWDARTEVVFQRRPAFQQQWKDETGLEGLDELLQEYYREHPEVLELDQQLKNDILPKRKEDAPKYKDDYILAEAWSKAMGAVSPNAAQGPPEVSDFPRGQRPRDRKPRGPQSKEFEGTG